MDNERLNSQNASSENDSASSTEAPASEESVYEFNAYTAVSSEPNDESTIEAQPSAPVPPKKKSRSTTRILIAAIAVLLALMLLLTGVFSAVAIALYAVISSNKAPVTGVPPQNESHESSVSLSVPKDEESTEPSDVITAPSIPEETPPPESYSQDGWYDPDDLENDHLSVYEKVCAMCNPSIVAISTDVGSGSGIVWSSDGYIVTNHHVIDGATSLSVMLSNGEKYPATRVATNQENDLALIRINVRGLLPVTLGDSDELRMGQPVIAIGNALGILSNTATEGILSAITREITIEGQTMNLMQISAPINPGNSGGGCFDINGKLIGVVNAKTSATGIEGLGFAIPVNTAKQIIGEMIANDDSTLQKGLGLTGCYEITAENYAEFVVESYVGQVEELNGAPLYGIYVISDGLVDYVDKSMTFENGDIIKTVNGKEIKRLEQITEVLKPLKEGDELTITVIRMVQSGGFIRPTYALKEFTFKIRVIELYK